MTTIIVNDASCLIDLRKGRLLHAMLRLPYHFVVPLPVRESELLDFTGQEWQMLDDAGLETFDLPPALVARAFAVRGEYPALSPFDCFCLVTTQHHENGILLTGDGALRKVATRRGARVHGVLWIIDQLLDAALCDPALLLSALEAWAADKAVFLPVSEIDARLRSIRSLE